MPDPSKPYPSKPDPSNSGAAESTLRVLILGGTAEARQIADRASDMGHAVTLSLAGRTADPILPTCRLRSGGFGGPEGLARYLAAEGVHAIVDATHPFAVTISAHAALAAKAVDIPLLALGRPPWAPTIGDRWIPVPTMAAAAKALSGQTVRVFLAIGRQEVAAFRAAPAHAYLIRSVEPPDPADLPPIAELILARGPFAEAAERTLLATRRIEVVVAKNSGGSATYGKIAAARALGLPVVMVDRPGGGGGLAPGEILNHLAVLAANRGV